VGTFDGKNRRKIYGATVPLSPIRLAVGPGGKVHVRLAAGPGGKFHVRLAVGPGGKVHVRLAVGPGGTMYG
jgi:hypothetical protein